GPALTDRAKIPDCSHRVIELYQIDYVTGEACALDDAIVDDCAGPDVGRDAALIGSDRAEPSAAGAIDDRAAGLQVDGEHVRPDHLDRAEIGEFPCRDVGAVDPGAAVARWFVGHIAAGGDG